MVAEKLLKQARADIDRTMGSRRDESFGELQCRGDGTSDLRIAGSSYGPAGAGARMQYIIVPALHLQMLLAATRHGVSWLGIHDSPAELEAGLHDDYRRAELVRDDAAMTDLANLVNRGLSDPSSSFSLPLDIRATPIQLEVWRELCAIPRGTTRSYGEIARRIGRPAAARAVGHANGSNPIAIMIPCHRAIGSNGSLTGYRWGIEIKRLLLELEGALEPRGSSLEFSWPSPA